MPSKPPRRLNLRRRLRTTMMASTTSAMLAPLTQSRTRSRTLVETMMMVASVTSAVLTMPGPLRLSLRRYLGGTSTMASATSARLAAPRRARFSLHATLGKVTMTLATLVRRSLQLLCVHRMARMQTTASATSANLIRRRLSVLSFQRMLATTTASATSTRRTALMASMGTWRRSRSQRNSLPSMRHNPRVSPLTSMARPRQRRPCSSSARSCRRHLVALRPMTMGQLTELRQSWQSSSRACHSMREGRSLCVGRRPMRGPFYCRRAAPPRPMPSQVQGARRCRWKPVPRCSPCWSCCLSWTTCCELQVDLVSYHILM
mmetsp:Transcript_3423/g.13834  ORF Transcript_3423/g.13834 Transcript_3423/m.13834 type:complete len:318 (+) Transcript_3423:584-1537(+)